MTTPDTGRRVTRHQTEARPIPPTHVPRVSGALQARIHKHVLQGVHSDSLAELTGATAEDVRRALRQLEDDGLISKGGVLVDEPRLVPAVGVGGAANAGGPASPFVSWVVAFVTKHPGCQRKDLLEAGAHNESALQRALRTARSLGLIRMEGRRGGATWHPTHVRLLPQAPQPSTAPAVELQEEAGIPAGGVTSQSREEPVALSTPDPGADAGLGGPASVANTTEPSAGGGELPADGEVLRESAADTEPAAPAQDGEAPGLDGEVTRRNLVGVPEYFGSPLDGDTAEPPPATTSGAEGGAEPGAYLPRHLTIDEDPLVNRLTVRAQNTARNAGLVTVADILAEPFLLRKVNRKTVSELMSAIRLDWVDPLTIGPLPEPPPAPRTPAVGDRVTALEALQPARLLEVRLMLDARNRLTALEQRVTALESALDDDPTEELTTPDARVARATVEALDAQSASLDGVRARLARLEAPGGVGETAMALAERVALLERDKADLLEVVARQVRELSRLVDVDGALDALGVPPHRNRAYRLGWLVRDQENA